MCRFTLYLGPPVRLATLLTEPSHSLIHQSFHSAERAEPLNGDGFGVGWYAPRLTPEPAVFHAITPAWNHKSLHSIAKVVASPCILAHVRAASKGSEVNLANCHPFTFGRFLFMHNGSIGAFRQIRRRLLDGLSDAAYDLVRGSTDTEHLFAIFADEVLSAGAAELPDGPDGGAGARTIGEALSRSLARVLALVREDGDGQPSFLNVAVSDGARAAVARFTDHAQEAPESLYMLTGELYEPTGRRFEDRRQGDEGPRVLVASERLTVDDRWTVVPPNSLLLLDRWTPPRTMRLGLDGLITGEPTDLR